MARIPETSGLLQIGWLADAPAGFRETVVARCDIVQIAAGGAVYQVGDNGGSLFGVLDGRVEVHLQQISQTPTLIHIVGPGFWTGEFGAVYGRPRIISLAARSDVQMLRLPRAELLRMAEQDATVWHLLSMLALRNQQSLLNLLVAIRCEDPVQRVALVLVNLAAEPSPSPGAVDVLQTEIGTIARMSRGSVNAALGVLETRGLVRRIYRAVEIVDLAGLTALATGNHDGA